MSTLLHQAPIAAASLKAVLWPACAACATPNSAGETWCPRCGTRTPAPRNLGRIAYWHRNPLKRLAWWLGRVLRSIVGQ